MTSDAELLRLYAESDAQDAFTRLVQRHLPFTYSAALRQVGGNVHHAEEVVQRVFTLLARKATSVSKHPALIGWLCTTTYYTAAKLRRSEQRRAQAEVKAVTEEIAPSDQLDWDRLRPVIDDLLQELKERDRTAVLLRFFSNYSYGEIGQRLGLTENAARMRVDRALEALRSVLGKRGIASTSSVLGMLLSAQAVSAVPEGLCVTVSASAISAAAGGGAFIFMGSTLVKVGLAAGVLAVGAVGFILHHRSAEENLRPREQLSVTERQLTRINADHQLASQRADAVTKSMIVEPVHIPAPASATIQAPDTTTRANPEMTLTRLKDMRNVGRATPAETVQTVFWAIANGDEMLPELILLNKVAKENAREILAALSPEERKGYETPEKLGALYLSKYVLDWVDAVKIERTARSDFETVSVTLRNAQGGTTDVSLQQTPDGWLWKVKPRLLEEAKKDLLLSRTSPASAAGKP